MEKTDKQWREELTPEQYEVLRKGRPSGPSRAATGTRTRTGPIAAPLAVPSSSRPTQVRLRLRLAELHRAGGRTRLIEHARPPRGMDRTEVVLPDAAAATSGTCSTTARRADGDALLHQLVRADVGNVWLGGCRFSPRRGLRRGAEVHAPGEVIYSFEHGLKRDGAGFGAVDLDADAVRAWGFNVNGHIGNWTGKLGTPKTSTPPPVMLNRPLTMNTSPGGAILKA